MAGGFKRSGLFGLIGVVVVAIVIAVIASTAGNEANPKGTLALIFGVLAVFVVILFVLQRSDLERVAGGDAKAVQRTVAEGSERIENPTTMGEQQLWAALAVRPIDNEAIKARAQMWDAGRRSLRLGMIVALLIFLTVPSIYLFESFVPLLIGGPLIVIAALYGSFRALAPGRRDGQRLRQGRAGDGAARPRGYGASQGQHRGARSDNRPGRPEDPRRPGAERRAPRAAGLGAAGQRRGQPAQRGHDPDCDA
jgi:hypothetical protein